MGGRRIDDRLENLSPAARAGETARLEATLEAARAIVEDRLDGEPGS